MPLQALVLNLEGLKLIISRWGGRACCGSAAAKPPLVLCVDLLLPMDHSMVNFPCCVAVLFHRDKTLVLSVPSPTDLSARTPPDLSNPIVVRLRWVFGWAWLPAESRACRLFGAGLVPRAPATPHALPPHVPALVQQPHSGKHAPLWRGARCALSPGTATAWQACSQGCALLCAAAGVHASAQKPTGDDELPVLLPQGQMGRAQPATCPWRSSSSLR